MEAPSASAGNAGRHAVRYRGAAGGATRIPVAPAPGSLSARPGRVTKIAYVRSASAAAVIVVSMSASVWAAEMKSASYWLQGR